MRDICAVQTLGVISGCGSRRHVAAAQSIPATIPYRSQLVLIAFIVAVATLMLQGSTLPALIRRLRLEAPEEREWLDEQRRRARELSSRTGREELRAAHDEAEDPVQRHVAELVLERAEQLAALRSADDAEQEGASTGRRAAETGVALRHRMIRAQRAALVAAQEEGRIGEEAVGEALEQLDLDEASLSHRSSPRL